MNPAPPVTMIMGACIARGTRKCKRANASGAPPQCARRIGIVARPSTWRVTPPSRNWRMRLWP